LQQKSGVSRKRGFSIQCDWNFVFYARNPPECQSSLVNKVGNGESIAVILKRFDALSPAALENSSEAIIPSNTYSMQTVVR